MDKSLIFTMREKYYNDYLPASLLSDGTISLISLIIALYFEKRPLAVFEDPGRNIHPSLVAKIVSMMEEVSDQRQVIVTTHNPHRKVCCPGGPAANIKGWAGFFHYLQACP